MVRHFTLLFLNRTKSSRNDNPRTRHVHDHYAAITECAVSITRIVSGLHNLYCGVGPPSVPFLRFIFFTPINTWLSVNPSLLISPTHDGMLGIKRVVVRYLLLLLLNHTKKPLNRHSSNRVRPRPLRRYTLLTMSDF